MLYNENVLRGGRVKERFLSLRQVALVYVAGPPEAPAKWVWAGGGSSLCALCRWCEMQSSLRTWNIQIYFPAASLWSRWKLTGEIRWGQQKHAEEQRTWERTDWHFLRENKQWQVSCVQSCSARFQVKVGHGGDGCISSHWLTSMVELQRNTPCCAPLLFFCFCCFCS